uniref:Uncharacterized protein n=1 Tax=Panagrolaimus superbus TaxID=310955 RepID=A0A914YSE8_9BILA
MIPLRLVLLSSALLSIFGIVTSQSVNKVHLGFPEAWDGDKYRELYCPSKNIPKFLDGYFLCQLSAAYGDLKGKPGTRLNHMIDAIGAIGAFHISNGQVVFSAQYYPSRPYKIWEFYDRNMTKASVPWAGWSDYNLTAMARWEQVPSNPDSARFHPNLDFWRVGNKVVAGTEAPYWVGYEFDVRNLNKFKLFQFKEENGIFGNPRPSMIPISMAIHERSDHDGTIWGSFSAMNFNEQRFYQGIFTVSPEGVRKVVGLYDYGVWDANACGKDDEYIGDKTLLPGYIHSITSTENYIILPITSLLINPCKFKEPPMTNPKSPIQNGGLWGMDFYDMVPMRFLVFNKKTGEFTTQKPLEVFPSMFVTHQLNAFENPDGTLVADMVVYDSHDPYVKYFYTDFLTTQLYPSTARILRFNLDTKGSRVMYSYLVPQETIAADFPQINHGYEGRAYQWAYLVEHPFASDNTILKINVDDPAGSRNLKFKSDPSLVLHEPYFVARPDARREDDGVLVIRALDLSENKGVLLIVDAVTMTEIGRAYVPISIPFGFHNRFFSKKDLGLPEGFHVNQFRPTVPATARTTPEQPIPLTNTKASTQKQTTMSIQTSARPQPSIPYSPITQKPNPNGWSRITVDHSGTTKTYPSMPHTSAKPPKWLPVSATSEVPWWKRVQSTDRPRTIRPSSIEKISTTKMQPTFGTTHLPSLPSTFKPVQPEMPFSTPEPKTNVISPSETTETPSAMRELYEETIKALCRWLPRVFKTISSDVCIENSQKAVKWMSPIASNYADQLHIPNPFNPQMQVADDPRAARLPNVRPSLYRPVHPRGHYNIIPPRPQQQ